MSSVSQQGGKQLDLGSFMMNITVAMSSLWLVWWRAKGERGPGVDRGTALCTGWNPDQDCTDLREYNEVLYQIAVREGCAA